MQEICVEVPFMAIYVSAHKMLVQRIPLFQFCHLFSCLPCNNVQVTHDS